MTDSDPDRRHEIAFFRHGLMDKPQGADTDADRHRFAFQLDLDDLFLFETQRKMQKDRTVSLNGVLYKVGAALVGEKVTLRFDPAAASERPVQVCRHSPPHAARLPYRAHHAPSGGCRLLIRACCIDRQLSPRSIQNSLPHSLKPDSD